jgi:hypothetical protein
MSERVVRKLAILMLRLGNYSSMPDPHVLLLAIIRTIDVSIDCITPKLFHLDMLIIICQPYLGKLVRPVDLGRLPNNLDVLYLILKAEINYIC